MEIKTYNSAQLNDLICSASFAAMPVIPISTHRAISHMHNPRTESDDILLIIAYENDEMIGYLGVLADRIYTTDGQSFKCGWLSCMWVNPILRGKGIAKQLLATAFKTWNDHILVTEFTPEAKGLYDRSGGFNDLRTTPGLRCYRRLNLHEVLPKKSDQYKSLTPLLKLADAIANVPVDLLHLMRKRIALTVTFEQITQIDKALDQYIRSLQQYHFERRTTDELNWILSYPWLIESKPSTESNRYHFSSVADRFQNLCYRILDQSQIKGFLFFSIRDHHLKIPYAYFQSDQLSNVIQFIYKLMEDNKLNMLTIFHPDLVHHFSTQSTPFIYKRPIKRNYIISKVLDAHFSDKAQLLIQDGDADCAFT